MIEIMSGLPPNIVGVQASGWVRASDYESVLIPAVDSALRRNDRIRLYYELGDEFRGIELGAVFQDMRVGLNKLAHWERVAVVTDVGWIERAVSVFRFLVHGHLRVFATSQRDAALRWIREG